MSLHSLLRHELTLGTGSPAGPPTITPTNVASGTSQQELNRPPNSDEPQPPQVATPSPEEIQRVFDVAPLNVTNKRRRLAITTLIVACNLMQMICNLIGIAGGLEKLGVSGVHANWVGASYPYAILYLVAVRYLNVVKLARLSDMVKPHLRDLRSRQW
ncbi:hypothetical protein F5Y05DRAFT_389139 [Hypoxylon sp. FL0543]|nr:hypothetical protein F5Y05DRAFT_389139 [Hypoxylon sp. FL0543]